MKDLNNKVVDVADVKEIMKDYLRVWCKDELEKNIKVWFDEDLN